MEVVNWGRMKRGRDVQATLTSNPLAALRANGEGRGLEGLGALRVGFRADLTLVSQDWKVAKTWVGGALAFSNTGL